jgi:hypothetical protein
MRDLSLASALAALLALATIPSTSRPATAQTTNEQLDAILEDCPSSDDLRQRPDLGKGGSGLRMEAMRPGRDAASGDWRWSGV